MPQRILHYSVLLCVLAVALFNGVSATSGLVTAFDPDLYRDIGHAHSIAAGNWFADPQLRGEYLWYNPLAPAVAAAVSWLTGLDPATSYVRTGAWVGIFAPIAFYALLRQLIDRDTALLGLVAFTLIAGADPDIPYPATYSPWLHSWKLAQVFFYLTLITLYRQLKDPSPRWLISTGVLWGVTFLSHFYPALLLGAITVVLCLLKRVSPRDQLLMMGLAFITSLPYGASILFNYGMQVQNSIVVEWIYEGVRELGPYLARYLSWQLPIWLLGIWTLYRQRTETGPLLLTIFAVTVVTSLLYTSFWDNAQAAGVRLPPITFSIHTSFYFSVVLSILFALGAMNAIRAMHWRQFAAYAPFSPALIAVALLAATLPAYSKRAAYTEWPTFARYNEEFFVTTGFSDWIDENTTTETVILARPTQSLSMIVASGRKVVAGPPLWSNPYVDMDARTADQAAMFSSLEVGDWPAFLELANSYGVEYVLLLDIELAQKLPDNLFSGVLVHPQLVVLELRETH